MTDLKKAAQQALEAMDKATRYMSDSDYRNLNEAITALRAALAEEALQRLTDVHQEIEAAIAKEKEACAKLAEQTVCDTHLPTGVKIYGTRVAKAIRSRT
jgi:nucleotidyltransferase/DNA polymerase involved in DNA repair